MDRQVRRKIAFYNVLDTSGQTGYICDSSGKKASFEYMDRGLVASVLLQYSDSRLGRKVRIRPLGRIEQVASVQERVIDIVAEQLGAPKEKINIDTHFVNDLGADSLDTVELVMELEEEFDINIPDDAAEKIQTIGEAVKHIEESVQSSSS